MNTEATRTLVIEKEMAHPPQKIWRALTQGALLAEWLMDNDFQPVVGHEFNFRSTPAPTRTTITRVPTTAGANL